MITHNYTVQTPFAEYPKWVSVNGAPVLVQSETEELMVQPKPEPRKRKTLHVSDDSTRPDHARA